MDGFQLEVYEFTVPRSHGDSFFEILLMIPENHEILYGENDEKLMVHLADLSQVMGHLRGDDRQRIHMDEEKRAVFLTG